MSLIVNSYPYARGVKDSTFLSSNLRVQPSFGLGIAVCGGKRTSVRDQHDIVLFVKIRQTFVYNDGLFSWPSDQNLSAIDRHNLTGDVV
jgi:hypothetical protein